LKSRAAAVIVRLAGESALTTLGAALGLTRARPTIVLVGGASGVSRRDLQELRPVFRQALVPLAEELQAYVVDGGTDAGVMRLMGISRREAKAGFPLIGVAPESVVSVPDIRSRPGLTRLERHHTHFVLVPGTSWGAEVPWLAKVAGTLAREQPSVTVLVNGGDVAWQDVEQSAQVGRPVFIVAGTGRLADKLTAAIHDRPEDGRVGRLVASGLLRASDPGIGPHELRDALGTLLMDEE
jgi:hypothetical protein